MLSGNLKGEGKEIYIDDKILKELSRIFNKYPAVQKVLLFGSRARRDFKNTSDVDLAVFSEDISEREFNLLVNEIDEIDTVLSFDVVHYEKLKKDSLRESILRDGVLVYERKNDREVKGF
ncbi:nucleotidyltransferase domain-containing protein [Thermosediminibacter litoriperuensis]|uniref:Putative nucleotidyltransferase n=1 Tax=Thermosediminibacter litoriperuensis TaxID=291989 RepID=A0A5S5AJX3_9FIRM|nr:nucleotidyltransferase domain-containing protein [Thermosediminibacter litoriperuensis]TYP50917.1 putative nucleotidyltransferase [Thermosediminibacter litoriperuensis]